MSRLEVDWPGSSTNWALGARIAMAASGHVDAELKWRAELGDQGGVELARGQALWDRG